MKGGVGKSTLSLVTASLLHFDYKKPVLIVDCDDPQFSIVNMRDREAALIENDPDLLVRVGEFYKESEEGQIGIASFSPSSSVEGFDALLNGVSDDGYVIVDFPGRWSEAATAILALKMDYIISPIEPVMHSLLASLSFGEGLECLRTSSQFAGRPNLKGVFFVWNKVRFSVPTHQKVLERFKIEFASRLKGKMFDTAVTDSVNYGKEFAKTPDQDFMLSTLLPPTYECRRQTNVSRFVEEVYSKCIK